MARSFDADTKAKTAVLTRDQNRSEYASDIETETLFAAKGKSAPEEIEMGIAADGMSFVLEMLSDLSADKGAYALREAYSNAYDATRATGDMTRPIEIEISSLSDPSIHPDTLASALVAAGAAGALATLRVADHGCGMTTDEVKRYFCQYGASSKRADADAIGSKGLGSKAPLAIADAFLLESTKDGITTTALIERRNSGNTASVSSFPAADPKASGTTLTIPIADEMTLSQVRACAERLVSQNLDATIVFNGEIAEPSFVEETEGSVLKVKLPHWDDEWQEEPYAYMGALCVGESEDGEAIKMRCWCHEGWLWWHPDKQNIDYEGIAANIGGVNYDLVPLNRGGRSYPLFVVAMEPGYLNFTPSRDEIKDDEAKRKVIDAVREAVLAFDYSHVRDELLATWNTRDFLIETRSCRLVEEGDLLWRVGSQGNRLPFAHRSSFVKDGVDLLPLFLVGNGDDEKLPQRFPLVSVIKWVGDKRVTLSCARENDSAWSNQQWTTQYVTKKELVAEMPYGIGLRDVFKELGKCADLDVLVLTSRDRASLEGSFGKLVRQIQFLHVPYGIEKSFLCFFAPAGYELSDLDRLIFDSSNGKLVCADIDDALEQAKAYKKRERERDKKVAAVAEEGAAATSGKAGGEGVPAEEDAELLYETFYDKLPPWAYDITDPSKMPALDENILLPEMPSRDLDLADADFDGLASKCAIVMSGIFESREVRALVTLASKMREAGSMPKSIEMVVPFRFATEEELIPFTEAGGIILGDFRSSAPVSLVDGIDFAEGAHATLTLCDPNLVMGAQEAAEADLGDLGLLASEMRDIVVHPRAQALLAMLDEERFDGLGTLREAEGIIVETDFHSPNVIYTSSAEIEDEDVLAAKRLYEDIGKAGKEILGAFKPRQLRSANLAPTKARFELADGIAELMGPGANEMFEEYLRERSGGTGDGAEAE